jgi:hypothetical protein
MCSVRYELLALLLVTGGGGGGGKGGGGAGAEEDNSHVPYGTRDFGVLESL